MDHTDHFNIFFEQKNTQTFHHQEREFLLPESMPYLEKGDSSKYIDQFFAKEESPQAQQHVVQALEKEKPLSVQQEDEEFSITETSKFIPSSFHNFQKHLTICLKHSIQIQLPEGEKYEYQEAGVRLWKFFKASNINNKKALHLLLGQNNEQKISNALLNQFGLFKIYEQYDQKTMTKARGFLARQTLRQIQEGRIDSYVQSKKLKDKQRFKKYLQIFKEELESGFLKKRLSKEKALELQKCCC